MHNDSKIGKNEKILLKIYNEMTFFFVTIVILNLCKYLFIFFFKYIYFFYYFKVFLSFLKDFLMNSENSTVAIFTGISYISGLDYY